MLKQQKKKLFCSFDSQTNDAMKSFKTLELIKSDCKPVWIVIHKSWNMISRTNTSTTHKSRCQEVMTESEITHN